MVSTSGHKLLADDAINTLVHELLPMSYVLTPNVPEALLLLGKPKDFPIKTVDDLKVTAAKLGNLGPRYVLLKGGHVPMKSDDMRRESIYDVLYDTEKQEWEVMEKPFLISENTHGTGCSLASAIASNIANGYDPREAVKEGSRYITWAIETAPGFGKGKGPVNHIHSNYMLPFAP
jgi:hydroxymethylpyrimidine kinase/phosphomethylpyrimidine kinase